MTDLVRDMRDRAQHIEDLRNQFSHLRDRELCDGRDVVLMRAGADAIAALTASLSNLVGAAEVFEARKVEIGGCSDGYCVIVRPIGMHTNGGCRCWRDPMKMQRFALAANAFLSTARAAAVKVLNKDTTK